MRLKKFVSMAVSAAVVGSTLSIAAPAVVVSADDHFPDAANVQPRVAATQLRCVAYAPSLLGQGGPTNADQTISLTIISPASVRPGGTFEVLTISDATEIPTSLDGIQVNFISNILNRTQFSAGAELVSLELVPGTAYWKANADAPQSPNIPGGAPQISWNEASRQTTLTINGPFPAGGILQPPTIRTVWTATGAPGSTISARFGGSVPPNPTNANTNPWPNAGFTLTANANIPVIGTSNIPTQCAPDYGPNSNNPGQQTPALTSILIDTQGPDVTFRSPVDGLTIDLGTEVIADYECTDPAGIFSCEGDVADGQPIDTSTFGAQTFTVVAVDGLGNESTHFVTYNVEGNTPPEVTVGDDQDVFWNDVVTLTGSAFDPDTLQTVSYSWIQESGPAVELIDSDDPFNPVNSFVAPQGPATLVFRFVADDGVASGEDYVTVNVAANAPPTADAGDDQEVFGNQTVNLSGSGTDVEDDLDEVELSALWTQVDANGDPINPPTVTIEDADQFDASFTSPLLEEATDLFFKLTVTDSDGATASDTVTVSVAANRGPTGIPAPTIVGPVVAQRTVGNYVQLNLNEGGTDPDGTSSDLFEFELIQTSSTGATTPCAPTCPIATVELLTEGEHGGFTATPTSPVFEVPPYPPATGTQNLFFRTQANDGFGATGVSANLSVQITNTLPDVNWAVRSPGSPDTANEGNTNGQRNTVWAGADVILDASEGLDIWDEDAQEFIRIPTTDADGNELSFEWRQFTSATNTTNCSGSAGNACGLRSETGAVVNTVIGPIANFESIPNRSMYMRLRVNDGTCATSAGNNACDIRFTIVTTQQANTPPNINLTAIPTEVIVDPDGEDPVVVELDATVTDPNTTGTWALNTTTSGNGSFPAQTLSYQWTQVDEDGEPIDEEHPDYVELSDPTALQPTFEGPSDPQDLPKTLRFRLDANDTVTTSSATRAITFLVNGDPVANDGTINGSPGSLVTLSVDASDPDGQPLSYLWERTGGTGGPVTLSSTTVAQPTFTAPNVAEIQTYIFQVTVTDTGGGSDTATITVNVAANLPPIANAGPDQVDRIAGLQVTLNSSGSSDPEGLAITRSWAQVDSEGDPIDIADPTRVTLSNATAVSPTFTAPVLLVPSTLYFRLTVTDPGGLQATDTVSIGVLANRAPIADAGNNLVNVPPGANVQLSSSGSSDPDGHTITRQWTQIGGTAVTLSNATAISPTFTAPGGLGLLTFQLVVTDQFGLASDPDIVTVQINANNAPVANAGTNQSGIKPGQTVTLTGSGSLDPDGHTLTYSWVQIDPETNDPMVGGPLLVTLTGSAAQPNRTFVAPNPGPGGGILFFRLIVTDQFGLSSGTSFVQVQVDNNQAPTADAGEDQIDRNSFATINLSGSASDPDNPAGNQNLTYLWTQSSGPAVTINNAATLTPSFVAPVGPATIVLQLTVTDPYGASADDTVTVSIKANQAPTANAGPNKVAPPGGLVTLSGSASDPEGQAMTYQWTQVNPNTNAPIDFTVTLSSATALQPTFTAPAVPSGTVLRFRLVANDGLADSDASFVNVSVQPNNAPVANAGADITAGRQAVTQLNGSGSSDPDSHSITYQWTQVDGLGIPVAPDDPFYAALSNPAAVNPTFTAPAQVGEIRFRLIVTDQYGLASAPDTVVVTLVENTAPVAGATYTGSPNPRNANQSTTLIGSVIDPDAGETFTWSWVQLNLLDDDELDVDDPTRVTISNSSAMSPTFLPPILNETSVLRFRVTVTDSFGASDSAEVVINVNANRPPTLGNVTLTPTNANAQYRTVGRYVRLSIALGSDPDGTSNGLFGFDWVQTDADGEPCAPECPYATVELITDGDPVAVATTSPTATTNHTPSAREPVFLVPAITQNDVELYFKVVVDDGFGAESTSAVQTVALTNSAPTITKTAIEVTTGADFSIERSVHTAWNNFPGTSVLYGGMPVLLDARNAAVDPDDPDGPVTVQFQITGNISFGGFLGSVTTLPTAGACDGASVSPTDTANVWLLVPPTGSNGWCRIQWRALDSTGAATVWGAPDLCGSIGLLGNANCSSDILLHPGTTNSSNTTQKSANATYNLDSDFWFTLKQNASTPSLDVEPLPAWIFNSSPGAGTTVFDLEAESADGDVDFVQPLVYEWSQVDVLTADPLEDNDPTVVELVDVDQPTASFEVPEGGPRLVRFKVTVTDGVQTVEHVTDTMRISTRRPGAQAEASFEGGPAGTRKAGDAISLSAAGTTSPDGRELRYEWRQRSGPPAVIFNRFTEEATVIAPPSGSAGTAPVVLELIVRDEYAHAIRTVSFVTGPGPVAPTNVAASRTAAGISVSWTAPTDSFGQQITGYRIERRTADGEFGPGSVLTASTNSASTSFVDTTAANGQTYVYRVSAITDDGVGAGATSNEVTQFGVPGAPTGVSASAGNAAASVSWTAPASNGGSAITSFRIERRANGGSWQVAVENTGSTATNRTITGLVNGTSYEFRVSARNAAGVGAPSAPSAAVTPVLPDESLAVVPLNPGRVLDTRASGETIDGRFEKLGLRSAGQITQLEVAGRAGVPADAKAVTMNVTVTGAQANGIITVFPCGSPQPNASNINYQAGQVVANMVFAAVGANGRVCIYTSAATHLIADVSGSTPANSDVTVLSPQRVADSRLNGATVDGRFQATGIRGSGTVWQIQIAGRAGVPDDVDTVVFNLTTTGATGAGFLTAYPCGARPLASNLNYEAGQTKANLVVSKLSELGRVCIYVETATQVIIDVAAAGGPLNALNPARLLDTRSSGQTIDGQFQGGGRRGANTTLELQVRGRGGVPNSAQGVVLNLTALNGLANGFVTAFPCGEPRPLASNVNYAPNATAANLVFAKIGANGRVCLFVSSDVNLIADVTASF